MTEGLSRVKEELEEGGKEIGRLEVTENKLVIRAIRKLDKEALNLYNVLRAGVGAEYLRWTRTTLSRSRASGKI
jgi:hypothetical protein